MTADSSSEPSRNFLSVLQHTAAADFLRRWGKECGVAFALLITLAAPWVLKPRDSTAPSHYDRRLVIITPHNQKIRQEFAVAFARHWKQKTGETLNVDWRVQGASEISLFLRSEYSAAFERYWTNVLQKPWTREVAMAFGNSKITLPAAGEKLTLEQEARKAFLESDVGVKIDLFFGGGSFDYEQQAKAGTLVSADETKKFGLAPLMAQHPEWFKEDSIPQSLSGEPFYDPEKRWVGTCFSSFGIVFNRDVLRRLHIEKEPSQWADLADPRYEGQIALADPNKSGTVTKALEQIIQQQMQIAVEELKKGPRKPFETDKDLLNRALQLGWDRGMRMILRICANARYFTDASTKIPLEVAQGDAAAGMCIDFYGRSFEEEKRKPNGKTRVGFISPVGGSSIGVDPVGLMRGAPEPEVATAFMEFVLSDEGQKLWNYRPGTAGGPQEAALRRLPVRRDFYTDEHRKLMADGNATPFEDAKEFTYHPEWTGALFNVIRLLVRVSCIEVHPEEQHAWRMLKQANFPPRATATFEDLKLVNYQVAVKLASDLKRNDKEQEMRLVREMSAAFRNQYDRARSMARAGL